MRLFFIVLILSFFQGLHAEDLSKESIKTCAQLLAKEINLSIRYQEWPRSGQMPDVGAEATVMVKLEMTNTPSEWLSQGFEFPGVATPLELQFASARHFALFFVVHGQRDDLFSAFQALGERFPAEALSYRLLLSRPLADDHRLIKSKDVGNRLTEAVKNCFFSDCTVVTDPSTLTSQSEAGPSPDNLTIVTKEVRGRLLKFLRQHASSAEFARIDITRDFGLFQLMEDVAREGSGLDQQQVSELFGPINPKRSDGGGFAAYRPAAVERTLNAWLILVQLIDPSLVTDPFSAKTIFLLDQAFHAKRLDSPTLDPLLTGKVIELLENALGRRFVQEQGLLAALKHLAYRLPKSASLPFAIEYLDTLGFQSSDYNNIKGSSRESIRRLEKGMRAIMAVAGLQTARKIDQDLISSLAGKIQPSP